MDPTGHERSSSNPKKARRTLDESVIVIEDTCDGIDISNNTAVNVQNSSSDPENRKSKSSGARKTCGRKSHGTPHVVGDTRGGTSSDFADGHQASQRDDAGHCVRATGPRRSTNNTGPPGRDATGADLDSFASASAIHCSEQDGRVRDAGVGVQSALARHRDGPSRRPESSDGTDPGPPRAKRARMSVHRECIVVELYMTGTEGVSFSKFLRSDDLCFALIIMISYNNNNNNNILYSSQIILDLIH